MKQGRQKPWAGYVYVPYMDYKTMEWFLSFVFDFIWFLRAPLLQSGVLQYIAVGGLYSNYNILILIGCDKSVT